MKKTLTREQVIAKAIPVTESGCWIWTGAWSAKGYGQTSWRGSIEKRAHRLFYELHNGPIPAGSCVLHKCDTPACVNPSHLWLGSKAENASDRDSKTRMARGAGNGRAKLNDLDVMLIRISCRPLVDIAAEYGVDETVIGHIKNRRTWRHI